MYTLLFCQQLLVFFISLVSRFGRRPLLLVSYISTIVFSLLSAFSTSYIMFVIARFLAGASISGISIISIVLSKCSLADFSNSFFVCSKPCINKSHANLADVEWVNIDHRTFSGVIISLDWSIGTWILVLLAYFVNEWRILILVVTSPLVLSVIAWRYLNCTLHILLSVKLKLHTCKLILVLLSGGCQSLRVGS